MNFTMPLPEALALAARRRADRLAGYQADLNKLAEQGVKVTITAIQLLQLEDAGLIFDFDTGHCRIEHALEPIHQPMSHAEALTEIERRLQNWQKIQAGYGANSHMQQTDADARIQTYTECGQILAMHLKKVGNSC
ncbi:MAG: hypothetical protein AB7L09_24785 [Nitrospira sp.]